eukprot:tig00021589_g22714.t1
MNTPSNGVRRGLPNPPGANMCYINAPVQCIVSLPQFAETVLSLDPAQGPAGGIHRELKRLIPQLLGASGERGLSGDRLKEAVAGSKRVFRGGLQQDAQEFLFAVIDNLPTEAGPIPASPRHLAPTRPPAQVQGLFNFYASSVTSCPHIGCTYSSHTDEPDPQLALHLSIPPAKPGPPPSIVDLLRCALCVRSSTTL